MTPIARPAQGTHLFFLDDEGVLFSEKRQELHAFNTSAAVIWCRMEDGLTPDAIADSLAESFAMSPAQAAGFVADALADWAAKGLLNGTSGPAQDAPPQGWQPRADLPDYPPNPPEFLAVRHYQLLTLLICLRLTSALHLALLEPVLAHLAVAPSDAASCFDLIATDAGPARLYRDERQQDECGSVQEVVPMVYHALWMAALRDYPLFLNIHAAVVRTNSGCLLLPAPQGSGKSTLTAALIRAGFTYFSDEVALFDLATLRVAPFPQALCVKQSGISAVAESFPQAADLPLHLRADGKRVAYLPPPRALVPSPDARGEVRGVIFPRYAQGEALACQSVSKIDALGRIFDQCTVIDHRLDMVAVRRLVDWIASVTCHELVYGRTSDAVAAITEISG